MQHISIRALGALTLRLSAVSIFSFALSTTASATSVGEIVLVGGKCPGGLIPLDGRQLVTEDYPELSSVLGVDDQQFINLPNIAIQVANNPTQQAPGPANSPTNGNEAPQQELRFVTSPVGGAAAAQASCGKAGCISKPIRGGGNGGGSTAPSRGNGQSLGSLTPTYCIAAGGDTPPLIEVGLEYKPASNAMVFSRVDVSGYAPADLPADFLQGNIDLGQLIAQNPDVGRPNLSFVLVGENVCAAKGINADGSVFYYPGELRLSGVQIAKRTSANKADLNFGDDFIEQSALVAAGDFSQANFAYNNQRDEDGNPGFLAVDIVDDRELIVETRNQTIDEFNYRVQAQCGEPGSAFNVYYDPSLQGNGNGIDEY